MHMKTNSKSERQSEQRRMVEKAKRQPGVAAAAKVYGAATRYAPSPSTTSAGGFYYATGGNGR